MEEGVNMKTIEIDLPEEIEQYMRSCSEQRGSYEWFQDAFCAATRLAIDNAESVAQEFRKAFASGIDDEDEIEMLIEQLMMQSGLASLN